MDTAESEKKVDTAMYVRDKIVCFVEVRERNIIWKLDRLLLDYQRVLIIQNID
jgi:hypothetical protein